MFDCKVFIPSVTSPTPTVSGRDTSMWTLTSPDGSRVERYIVEFECRVRNITFVEMYMSVSASGGTGWVAINASCFGGLGQLYRVKVWTVSGPNISRALVCVTGVRAETKTGGLQCMLWTCYACLYTYIIFTTGFQSVAKVMHILYLFMLLAMQRDLQWQILFQSPHSCLHSYNRNSSSNCSQQSNSRNSSNCC